MLIIYYEKKEEVVNVSILKHTVDIQRPLYILTHA